MNKMIADALDGYNEVNTMMSLVLFEDAIYHIMRINRILESPRGNALLIGVGGSGKQSLSRLAAYISNLDVFQVSLKKGYGLNDLKADLAVLYLKAGLKNLGVMFLMTEGQVPDEKFLVLINDLLATGEIPELFPDDEIDNIVNAMRPEVKANGLFDSRENCWKFFIERIRQFLKVVLCFSPQGSSLRNRSRKFPAIINTTCIDWFHEWPIEALVSVSRRFLGEIEGLTPDMCDSISDFMSHVHQSVNEVSVSYLMNERRYNYTTPKSFLEQISLYRNLVSSKFNEIHQNTVRLVNGLEKLESASGQVDELKKTLVVQEKELAIKNEEANKLIAVVKGETDKVSAERAITNDEEKKVKIINDEVSVKFIECEADLRKAQPALDAAKAALDTLNRNNLTELKGFTSPPSAVVKVAAAVIVLMSAPSGKVPKDRGWRIAKGIMNKVDDFLLSLINYKKESIPPMVQKAVQPYLDDPEFEPEYIKTKSFAAAGLCAWVINIMKFYEVFCEVEPKRLALEDATRQLNDAEQKLNLLRQKLAVLQDALGKLTKEYEKATKAKAKCQAEADQTAKTIDLSNRLVLGLASENVRWHQAVETFNIQAGTVPGDILLVTAFISYVGCFTKPYRIDLMENHWLPYFRALPNPIPTSENLDIMGLLSDDAKLAKWQNEGLPNDRMSSENATILTNAERWPLMIDPQLQGIKWIKRKYGDKLVVVRLNQKNYIDKIEKAISDGEVVLIENIDESIDPILDPIIGRNTIKKGKVIKVGDKEINFNKNFRLILHTKLANPHYKPELQAQTTLINFTVTKDSLEDQLLAMVVAKEQPELEVLKADLTRQQNEYKITLKHLEDSLLARLSEASGNFLGDYELVENLETTKRTSADVEEKVKEAKVTEAKINEFREAYRVAGSRGSLLYFILNDLNKIHPMYQFSLKAFGTVFELALQKADPADTLKQRLMNLIDCITFSVFQYTSRGLFESDKIIFMTQMTFQILLASNDMALNELDFLLRFPVLPVSSPVDFLSSISWGGVKTLSAMEEFKNLDRDIEGSSKRWKKFVESETPEQEKFPQEWKNKTSLQKLCMMRTLRPDRMTYTIKMYVEEKLGKKFVDIRATEFSKSYEESTPSTPIFFILSPGVDPLKDVEKLGKVLGFTFDNKNFHNISLGQGQEIVAENAMDTAAAEGHWVILQNVHLVARWLPSLEKKLEQYSNESHPAYRVFISAEAASSRESHIMPQGILESAIKITNEPPTGMFANLHKALDIFSQDTLDMCAKEMEFKSILFALCYFHAVVSERRKFGPQGWNRMYPFNFGDLNISVSVLYNYLEANSKVPWEDLRYLFGEIMYGGHITDDWDRRLCKTYLEEYMNPFMLDGELYLAPGFPNPPNLDYRGYHNYIDEMLPNENPILYGLHSNAEIDILSQTSEALFRSVFELQPRDAGFGATGGVSREEKIKGILDDIKDKLPEQFLMQEIMSKVPPEERTPYVVVAFQECERMNILTTEIKRSLIELNLGLKGELTITADMENLSNSLYMDIVPETWALRAYPSLYSLTPWYADLLLRIRELEMWTSTFAIAGAVWLAGFFNPQSFLTAIMQQMARKNEWPLDKMCLQCDVLKKSREEIGGAPREGAYVCGLFMEGARWDVQSGMIAEAKLKELAPAMPVIYIKAIPVDRQETKNIYECPVYKTKQRGQTFVWKFNLENERQAFKMDPGWCRLAASNLRVRVYFEKIVTN
ncbi:hypothetical protein HELRODRAFT_171012 [Helobdella robusta]|uniref:AAA+ ATPase domain-containing protein n=1 Tax=Helobdella robusta TaxID=6412 RepID=T1F3P6_HELRO|nr:hypothetical protein HELRODRAFT_171012 [Helobdella robusta]ESO06977.1 hypothetical protein HELRODRAFT_171012 [Helobdella robusta]